MAKNSLNAAEKLVAKAIPAYPAPPLGASEIATSLNMPVRRVHEIVASIKDKYPQLPLTSSSAGYRWSRNIGDTQAHIHREASHIRTRTRRNLLGALLEPYERLLDPKDLGNARRRMEFVLAELDEAVSRTTQGSKGDEAAVVPGGVASPQQHVPIAS